MSPWGGGLVVPPFVIGTVKDADCCRGGACCCCCWGGDDGGSISIELRPLMAVNWESRLRCSGGRLRGWVSGSIFFRREDDDDEPGSVDCLGKALELRSLGLASALPAAPAPPALALEPEPEPGPGPGDAGRANFLVGDLLGDLEAECFAGEEDLTGEGGSEGLEEKKSSSSNKSGSSGLWGWWCFLDVFLEKNFIESKGPSAGAEKYLGPSGMNWRSLSSTAVAGVIIVSLYRRCDRQPT